MTTVVIQLVIVYIKKEMREPIMYPKFYSLESERRERIINAAIKEFALIGYDNY